MIVRNNIFSNDNSLCTLKFKERRTFYNALQMRRRFKSYVLQTMPRRNIVLYVSYARQLKKCSAYLAVVGIHGSSHETFRLFQIFQSVPEGTAGAAEIPGCRAAIYQLLCA